MIFWVAAIFLLLVSYGRPPLALAGFLVRVVARVFSNTAYGPTRASAGILNLSFYRDWTERTRTDMGMLIIVLEITGNEN